MKTLKFILIIALLSSCSITRNATTNKHYSVSVSKSNEPFAKKERTRKIKHVKHRSKLPLSYRVGLFINNLRKN